ncbi:MULTISPECIES: hypothetical protein [Bacteroides]|uniref:hypothetical protein n=1 Tax=Bacteroides TaxID=816 RepID=UPI0011C22F43|nr:hypothetical protein [Bacteroides nordii]
MTNLFYFNRNMLSDADSLLSVSRMIAVLFLAHCRAHHTRIYREIFREITLCMVSIPLSGRKKKRIGGCYYPIPSAMLLLLADSNGELRKQGLLS